MTISFVRIALAFALLLPASAFAATYSYTITNGTTSWTANTGWDAGNSPVSDTTTDLVFGPSGTFSNTSALTSVSNNNKGTFTLNELILQGTGSATTDRPVSVTIAGDPLSFSGAGSRIAIDASNGAGTSTVSYAINTDLQLNGTLALTGNGTAAFTLGGIISGSSGLTKSGTSSVTLSGNNTYTGGTFVTAGTIGLGADNALGTGAITITGGGLRAVGAPRTLSNALFTSGSFNVGRSTTFSGTTTLNADTTIVATNPDGPADGNSTFSGPIVGNFGLTIAEGAGSAGIGVGNVIFSGTNTYTGGTTLSTRLLITSDAALGAASGALTLNGGTLRETTSIASTRNLVLGSGGGTIDVAGGSFSSWAGTVSGPGGLTLTSGFMVFSGSASYLGATAITGGILKFQGSNIAAGPATPGIAVSTGASLYLGGDLTYGGVISGAGRLEREGIGTAVLTGANTYTGGTTITGGAVQIGNGGTTGSIAGDVALSNGATLAFNRSNAAGFNGTVTGSGYFSQIGAGTLTLGSSASISPATTLLVTNQATLDLGGTSQTVAGLGASTARLVGNLGNGTITTTSANSYFEKGTISTTLAGTHDAARLWIGGDAAATVLLNGTNNMVYTADHNQVIIGHSTTGAAGIVKVGNANALAASTENVEVWSGTLDLNGQSAVRANSIQLKDGANSALVNATAATTASFANGVGLNGANQLGGAGNLTLGGVVSGSGSITKIGAGVLTLGGANTYTGDTTISAGSLQVAGTLGSGSYSGAIANGGNLTFASSSSQTLSGVISGTGIVAKSGSGTLTLSGNNTYSGTTTISGGTLQIGDGGTTGSISGNITDNAALAFNLSSDSTYGGAIGGSGSLTKLGAGTLTLTGANTFTGGTTISGGTLMVSNGGLKGNVLNNAALVFSNQITDYFSMQIYDGVISGSGSFTMAGGYLSPTKASTYTGATIISGGALVIGNSAGGGNILPTGTALSIASGGALILINTNNLPTVTVGSLSGEGFIDNSQSCSFTVGDATSTTFSGQFRGTNGGSITKVGAGTLTLTGNSTYDGGTFIKGGLINFTTGSNLGADGIYGFNANITLNGGGLQWATGNTTDISPRLNALGASGGVIDTNGNDVTFATALTGTGSLTKNGAGTLKLAGTNTYSGITTVSSGTLLVGKRNGFYGGTPANWTATRFIAQSGATVGFGVGGAGEFTAADLDVLKGVATANGGFKSGSFLGIDTTNAGGNFTYGSVIANPNGGANVLGLAKYGAGTLTLTGNNTYTGGTVINAGLINFTTNANLSGANITLNGGGLQWATGNAIDISPRLNALGAAGGVIDTNGNDLTFASPLTGPGALTKIGAGTLTLSVANTYTGGTTIGGGLVQFSTGANLGSGNVTLDGGTLQWAAGNTLDISPRLNLATGGGLLDLNGNNLTMAGTISGAGPLRIIGGTLTLGSSSVLQNATLSRNAGDGTLNLGALTSLTLGGLSGNLDFNYGARPLSVGGNGASTTYTGVLSGSIGLIKEGSGTLTLTGNNTYTSSTELTGGTLSVSSAANLGNATNNIKFSGGTLQITGTTLRNLNVIGNFDGGIDIADAGNLFSLSTSLSGGGLTKLGAGTLQLTGTNSYVGPTTLKGGTLAIVSNANLGSPSNDLTFSGGILQINGTSMTNFGTHNVNYSTFDGGIDTASSNLTFTVSKALGGTSFTKRGFGVVVLSGTDANALPIKNTQSGTTTVDRGTLRLTGTNYNDGANEGAIVVNSGGTLQLNAQSILGQNTSSPVVLTINAGGLVTNTGAAVFNTFNNLHLNGGELRDTGGSSASLPAYMLQGTVTVGGSSTSRITKPSVTTFNGIQIGNGNNGGATTFDVADATGSAAADLIISADLLNSRNSAGTVRTSGLIKTGPGTLTLSGTNTYTGATTISAGTLVADGSLSASSAVAINNGATLGGHGTVGAVAINSGGKIAPGNSPGTMNTGGETWAGGAGYVWELNNASDAAGAKGVTYDWLNSSGTLNITATSGSKFTIYVTSLTAGNAAGLTPGFVEGTTYQWVIATGTSVSGFSADKFAIDTSAFFNNSVNRGSFTLTQSGGNILLNLTYTAVPEPSTYAAAIAGLLGAVILLRRRPAA